jgi:hypothetical protein
MTEDVVRQACKDNCAAIVKVIVPLMITDELRKIEI